VLSKPPISDQLGRHSSKPEVKDEKPVKIQKNTGATNRRSEIFTNVLLPAFMVKNDSLIRGRWMSSSGMVTLALTIGERHARCYSTCCMETKKTQPESQVKPKGDVFDRWLSSALDPKNPAFQERMARKERVLALRFTQ